MTSRTEQLYRLILDRLIAVFREENQQEIAPIRGISDFELAILQAMAAAFPGIQMAGCWFHAGQVTIFDLVNRKSVINIFFLLGDVQEML